MDKFGKFMAGLLLYALSVFVRGIVLMFLWNWFITPLGIVKIGFWLAQGVALTLRTFVVFADRNNEDNVWACMIGEIIGYLLVWGVGAIIQLFL